MIQGDPFKRVKSGDPFALAAEAWNAFLDMAKAGKSTQRTRIIRPPLPVAAPGSQVLIKNNAGAYNFDRFGVMGIESPFVLPTGTDSNLATFQAAPVLVGTTPVLATHAGNFAILQEPIPADGVGRAIVSGVTIALISILDESHKFADVLDGDRAKLVSGTRGAARIMWKDSGTGDKWAIIRIGNVIPGELFKVLLTKTSGSTGDKTHPADYVYTAKDLASATTFGTGLTPDRPRANGAATDATIGIGYFDNFNAFGLLEAFEKPGTGGC